MVDECYEYVTDLLSSVGRPLEKLKEGRDGSGRLHGEGTLVLGLPDAAAGRGTVWLASAPGSGDEGNSVPLNVVTAIIYIYTHTYMHTETHLYIYIYMCVNIYTCRPLHKNQTSIHIYIYIYTRIHRCGRGWSSNQGIGSNMVDGMI